MVDVEDTDKEIEDIDNEIEAIHQILSKSIDQHYGIVNDGKKLSTDEHFIFWDRMWNLVLQKRKMLNADINGAIGILRKKNVFSDVDLINLRDRGDVVSPRLLKYGV